MALQKALPKPRHRQPVRKPHRPVHKRKLSPHEQRVQELMMFQSDERIMAEFRRLLIDCGVQTGPKPLSDKDLCDQIAKLIEVGKLQFSEHDNKDQEITADQLKRLLKGAPASFRDLMVEELNRDRKAYHLDSVLRKTHFFAQITEEASLSLSNRTERVVTNRDQVASIYRNYYSKHPEELQTDTTYTDSSTKARHMGNEDIIANKGMAGKIGNSPDPVVGDGSKYRGRGLLQITGRNNYADLNDTYFSLYGEHVDFLKDYAKVADPLYSIRTAICYWVAKKIAAIADDGSSNSVVDRVTHAVNGGGMVGKLGRRENFTLAYTIFADI